MPKRFKLSAWRLIFAVPALLLMMTVPGSGQVPGILHLEVQFVNAGTSLEFGNLKSLDQNGEPVSDTSVVQVRLSVNTTLGRPYILTQTLQGDTMNQSGAVLPYEAIRFRVEQEAGSGLIRVPDGTPLRPGSQEIYFSDSAGSPASILVTYEMTVPAAQRAGNYRNTVNYRVDAN
ncbi:MAG: hypothetical protein WC352_00305 [Candidatus Omnitrophota bacterium]